MTTLFRMSSAAVVAVGILAAGLVLDPQQSKADSRSKGNSQGKGNSQDDDDSDEARIQQGLAIAPVPLNLKGKNRARVGLGSYLVNAVAGCNDCHTWRVIDKTAGIGSNYENLGDPFLGQPEKIYQAGYMGGGRPFGPFRSRNITPDATGKVADGYSNFKEIMRHGFDPDHLTPVLQVMPWPVYRNMTDNDLQAIYEYLSAIPCVEGDPGESLDPTKADGGTTHRCN